MNMICEKLLDYNLVDVEGLVLLNENWQVIQDQFEQAEIVCGDPSDGIYASKLHDHDVLRDYRNEMVFDTKYQKWDRIPHNGKSFVGDKFIITEDIYDSNGDLFRSGIRELSDIGLKGGYVPPPLRKGMFKWVAVLDYNKQYPNAIISSNAGIRTAIDYLSDDENFVYDTKGKQWNKKDLIETPIGFFRKDIFSVNKSKFTNDFPSNIFLLQFHFAYFQNLYCHLN